MSQECHGHFGRFYHNFANFVVESFASFRDGEAVSCHFMLAAPPPPMLDDIFG
jgi:hypothetical protein